MSTDPSPQLREQIENTIRFLAVDAVNRANSGHPGAPMGLARPAFELWNTHLRFDPSDPQWPLRDRFILSNGHGSMLIYSLLHLFGYDLSLEDIIGFRTLGSKTPGHPEYGDTPGIEVTTGPLGQGFGHSVGMALAARMARSQFGNAAGGDGAGPGHHYVYGIAGDGDLMEGISSEAASLAGHLRLGNLIYLYDDNQITIDGPTSISFSENVPQRFESQGWHVTSIDGEDVDGLNAALEASRNEVDRPSLIATRTVIGRGSPNRAGTSKAHGAALGAEETALSKEAVGWPADKEFYVPDEVRAYMQERIAEKKRGRSALDSDLAAWRQQQPERAKAWDVARSGQVPAGFGDLLSEGMQGADAATRSHSSKVLGRITQAMPNVVGGSADLAGSDAPPFLKERGRVGPGAEAGEDFYAGGNIHFGVREHAMGAVTNGIALDGTFRPYSGTFLIFSDYMRPAIRLAALMKQKSIFVFTHDSIFLGEDGPTHQPIEQLDSLRAIPGLSVFRPADGVETAASYAWILEQAKGPAMLALTRQKLPGLERPADFSLKEVWKGAYAVKQPDGGAKPAVVMLATGSEVSLACDAADKLAAAGVAARVVSVPCLELFLQQSAEYQESLVPNDDTALVAVEVGVGESFRRLVGRNGLVYGIDRFGASAPATDLAEHFGFTPDALAARVREHVESN
jgi:transketolase